jgi:2-polyprenyl-6-methoxyphenol hydroxylase-like FAD-dependent oxidoreductase
MYALLIQQPRLVRLLEKRARDLGVDIRWGHELAELRSGEQNVALTVATTDRSYRLDAGYLVGADGGRSTVRKNAGIGFPGHTSPIVSRLAHVSLPEESLVAGRGCEIPGFGLLPFGHNRFANGTIIVFPIEPDRPLIGTVEYGWTVGSADGPLTLDELRESIRRIIGVDMPLEAPKGPGPHALRRLDGINSRQAERYRAGRVLLVGDSAHVHSPMGGPGLNLGMQDAVNLGWKLAAAVNGRAPDGLLDTYESERYPVGERVMMHSQAQLALAAPGPEVEALRSLFTELVPAPDVTKHMAGLLAGSDIRYDVGDDHRLSGLMVPDLELVDGRRVVELLREGRPILIDTTGGAASAVAQAWSDRVDAVAERMTDGPAAILIRPDGYVAWAADTFADRDARRLRAALARWFGEMQLSSFSRRPRH